MLLWYRLAATALIRPPNLGTSMCLECGPRKDQKKKKKRERERERQTDHKKEKKKKKKKGFRRNKSTQNPNQQRLISYTVKLVIDSKWMEEAYFPDTSRA